VRLEYLSGVTVSGTLENVLRQDHRNLILSFSNCTVTDLSGRVLFEPGWGTYDLTVGSAITSVYGGVADREQLQLYKPPPATTSLRVDHDEQLMACYALVERLRQNAEHSDNPDVRDTLLAALERYPDEWLLRADILEIADADLRRQVEQELQHLGKQNEELARLTAMVLASDLYLGSRFIFGVRVKTNNLGSE
jgi:phenylalanine-4-hydroxylase